MASDFVWFRAPVADILHSLRTKHRHRPLTFCEPLQGEHPAQVTAAPSVLERALREWGSSPYP